MADLPALQPAAVKAIVFDLDGTLVDSYGPIASSLNHARAGFDLPPVPLDFVRSHVGRGLECLIADLVGADRVEGGVRLFREHYASVYRSRTHALPEVSETLRALHAGGYRMAVASNKPARFTRPILETLGLQRYLRCALGPDTVGVPKPDPAMLEQCLERLEVSRTAAVYVGDMVLDVESARRAGMPVVLVPGGSSSPDDLEATGQTTLDSFAALLGLFPGIPR